MKKDLISIIIPTYNREKTILRSINSVLNQTYNNIEVIVVDDCSTDNTKKIIDTIKDERLKYIKLRKNSGACVARNKGIEVAKGKYISFNDSDDEYLPNKLEMQYNNLIKNKSDMDFCKITIIDDNNSFVIPTEQTDMEMLKNGYFSRLCNGNYISTQTILIDKKVAQKTLFNPELPRLQDYDFVLRVVPKIKISYTKTMLVNLYRQKDSISNSNEKMQKAICLMMNYDYNLNRKEDKFNLKKYFLNTLLQINDFPTYENYLSLENENKNLNNLNHQLTLEKQSIENNFNSIVNSKRWNLMNKILKIFKK